MTPSHNTFPPQLAGWPILRLVYAKSILPLSLCCTHPLREIKFESHTSFGASVMVSSTILEHLALWTFKQRNRPYMSLLACAPASPYPRRVRGNRLSSSACYCINLRFKIPISGWRGPGGGSRCRLACFSLKVRYMSFFSSNPKC